jgi:hypothetical protein
LKVQWQKVVVQNKDEAVEDHDEEGGDVGQRPKEAARGQKRVRRWEEVLVDGKGDEQQAADHQQGKHCW